MKKPKWSRLIILNIRTALSSLNFSLFFPLIFLNAACGEKRNTARLRRMPTFFSFLKEKIIQTFNINLILSFCLLFLTHSIYTQNQLNFEHLSVNGTTCLLQDQLGFIWVGTYDGLNRFDGYQFKEYRHNPGDVNSLSNNYIRTIFEDRSGKLWIGTRGGGLNYFDPDTDRFIHFRHDPQDSTSLSDDRVEAIFEDHQGYIWIGTWGGGLNRLGPISADDQVKRTFTRFQHDPNNSRTLSDNSVFAVYEDRQYNLWIGTWKGGLNRLIPGTRDFVHYPHDPNDPNSISAGGIRTIYQDDLDNLWVGVWGGGLHHMEREPGKFTVYQHDPNDPTSLSNDRVWVIYEDRQHNLWIGTRGGGLNLLEWNQLSGQIQFKHFREKDGLANDIVFGILEDEQTNLWLSTRRGLSCFNPNTFAFVNFDVRDNDRQINNWAYFKGQNGEFYFGGGIGGVYHFNPKKLIDNKYIPPIVFTRFARYNRKDKEMKHIIHPGINHQDTILLSYRDNILDFEFSALNFIKPEENQYAYRMEGLSNQWIQLGNKHRIMLTNLAPGAYTLHIIGSNNRETWNRTGRKLTIIISPPWWWREWSKTLYVMLTLGLLYLIQYKERRRHRSKLALEKEKNLHLHRVDQLKDHFLSNTSHELRTPLHGIIGLSESLYDAAETISSPEIRENLDMIISSGKRLANMVNDILDFSKLKNHQIELRIKPVHIKSLVKVILKINQFLLAGKVLRLENEIPDNLPPVWADEERLQQIIFNLVGNAIKYTESGYVRVGIVTPPKNIRGTTKEMIGIYVKDSGIGIPKHKQELIFQPFQQADSSIARKYGGTGLGLSITKQLVELHCGALWVESEEGKGSTFFFTLPVIPEADANYPMQTENDVIARLKDTPPVLEKKEGQLFLEKNHSSFIGMENGLNHILVVDDEPINHKVFQNYLAGGLFRISNAMNGEEALNMLEREGPFNLVLLDVMMPRISGYEVCQKIREKYPPNELPVIMISAKNQVQDLVQGLALGANDYLAKPFSKQEFMARVQTQLDLHRINSVISKFVPNEFLRLLGKEKITEVRLGDQTEQIVTVFFNDIRDYTALSETMTPEENFKFVNAYNGRMGPFIRKHNGFINQYLGDAIMSIFPQSPLDALQAAIEMQQALQKYNLKRAFEGKKMIKAGAGLHTGNLIMGIIGDHLRMDAAAISDTVNTASRIESLTKYYCVNILLSEDCWRQIQALPDLNHSQYHARYLGRVQVKGRREPIGIYECICGDTPEVMKKKLQTMSDFEAGIKCFTTGIFSSSITAFDRVLEINPRDQTARFFQKKAKRYQTKGPPKNWSGVELMNEK